jgi:RNA polymerase sigma-70 factor (ECF subfamily)
MTLSMRAVPHHGLSDAALAEHACAGDERAFEALDRRHRSTLLRHCNGILRNSHDAEEAVQGALLKAYRAFSTGQRPASLLPWLMVIARNECFDIIRARQSTEELPLHVASSAIRPDELVVHREEARALRADIKALPKAQYAALVLRSVGDLPHAEIARLLGGTPAEARTLCHEARLSLAECQEGRRLECSAVLDRIETGDGRALRARRIRAHLRACEGCREAADRIRAPRRSGLGGLFPSPWFAAIRSLLFGGGASGAIGGSGSVAVVGVPIVAAVTLAVGVVMGTGGSTHAHAPSVPTPAASTPAIAASTPATLTPSRSVSRARGTSSSGGPSSPGAVAAADSSTLPLPLPGTGAAGSAADQSIPSSALSTGVQTPSVRVPGTGITVPSVELPPAPTIPAQTPSVQLPITGGTVPTVQLSVGLGAEAGGGGLSPVVESAESALDGRALLTLSR